MEKEDKPRSKQVVPSVPSFYDTDRHWVLTLIALIDPRHEAKVTYTRKMGVIRAGHYNPYRFRVTFAKSKARVGSWGWHTYARYVLNILRTACLTRING